MIDNIDIHINKLKLYSEIEFKIDLGKQFPTKISTIVAIYYLKELESSETKYNNINIVHLFDGGISISYDEKFGYYEYDIKVNDYKMTIEKYYDTNCQYEYRDYKNKIRKNKIKNIL